MRYRAIDWGDPSVITNNAGKSAFKPVTINWSEPKVWKIDDDAPIAGIEPSPGYLYALVRNHHKSKSKDSIAYVGVTNCLDSRFQNHPKAKELCGKRGSTALSVGRINFHGYRTAENSGNRRAIEELEHIIIWALEPEYNERKFFTLPGMGSHRGRAWQIYNTGFRFSGRMPMEIIYPWMLIKNRRDNSRKKAPSKLNEEEA